MSQVTGSGDPSRLMQWVEHHPIKMTLLMVGFFVSEALVKNMFPDDFWTTVLAIAMLVSALTVSTLKVIGSMAHMRGFCDTCFSRPLGGPKVAEKKQWQLQFHHWYRCRSQKFFFIIVGCFFVILLLPIPGWIQGAVAGVMLTFFTAIDVTALSHAWLIPWCPWCKDDGFWTEGSPTPDPAGTKQHTH